MNKKKLLAPVFVLIAASVAVYFAYNGRDIQASLELSGNVEVTEVNLGFKQAGRISAMRFEEGQSVSAGDLLAELDNTELRAVVAQFEALTKEAEARYADLLSGARGQDIKKAKTAVDNALMEFQKAERDYERTEALLKSGVSTAASLDTAKSVLDAKRALHATASENLNILKEGARKKEIEASSYRVEQARAQLEIAKQRLSDASLASPVSGVILRKYAEAGEIASPSFPVYTIGDLSRPWVKVYIKEDRLGKVALGQKAVVRTDSFPDKDYTGTVTYISPQAEFTPKNVQTKEERVKLVFALKVSVVNFNNELKPGMPADVVLIQR